MRKKFLLTMLTLLFVAMGSSGKLFAQIYVNSNYNSNTSGWGTTYFSSYSSALNYAANNAKNNTMYIEYTSSISGNCIDQNTHKNLTKLGVVIQNGAIMGNANSKWDMTYPVTIKAGGRLQSARGTSSGYGNTHIKNTLTIGDADSDEKAVIDFINGVNGVSYKTMSIAVLYNGKIVANNATINVGDFGFTGDATFNNCDINVEGIAAFGKNNWYKQTLTNCTMYIKGNNLMNENTYYSTNGTILKGLTMAGSTITVDDKNSETTTEPVTIDNLTMNSSHLELEGATTVKLDGTLSMDASSSLVAGELTVGTNGKIVINANGLVSGAEIIKVSNPKVLDGKITINNLPNGFEAIYDENGLSIKEVTEVATYEELIAALANDGAFVRMTSNITAAATQSSGYGKAGIVVEAGDILDGNGKKLTINGAGATWDCAIAMRGGEVKNLTISGAFRGIFMPGANGDVVVDNCVFDGVVYTFNTDAGSKEYTVTIKNTTLNGWTSFSNAHKAVVFESCEFGEGSGYAFCRPYQATTFIDCEFNEGYEFDTKSTTEVLAFDECTYNGRPLSAENNAMFYNGGSVVIDGTPTDVNHYVATIGANKYLTLEDAFAAAAESQTITLLADATPALTSQRAITKAAVIDLGGKTLNLTEDDLYFGTTTFKNGTIVVAPSVNASTAVFWMFANQTLTFDKVKVVATGVTGTYLIGLEGVNSHLNLLNGSEIVIDNTDNTDFIVIAHNGNGNILVEDSKIDINNVGRGFLKGNVTISGSSKINLKGISKAGFRIEAGQTLSIEDTSEVTVEGTLRDGGIHLTDPSANYTKAETATVNATINQPQVAKVGNTIYKSLIAAVEAVEDGGTITLVANETFTKTNRTHNSDTWYDGLYYVGDKSFTIDLGGFIISQDGAVNDYLLNFKNSGSKANTITLKNGTIDAGTAAFCAICTSSSQANELTINTEDINIINNISNGSTIKLRGGAVLNVKAGTKITGKNSYLGIECVASTVNIYDGAEIYMNGTTSYNGCLVGACGGGTVNVYGGYGKGAKGGFIAMTSGGTINVEGGEWIANTDGNVGNNSNVYVLTAQSNINEQGFVGPAIINVTGGTFRGGMDAWVLNNHKDEKAELNIKGGNFNANPTSYVAADYIAVENNGVWNVVKAAAKIGAKAYASLEEAFKAATTDCTIEILSDVTVDYAWDARYTGGKFTVPVTINGNGKTIKFTASVNDNNYQAPFRFEADATVKNLTIDMSAATDNRFRAISSKGNLTVDNCKFIGKDESLNCRAIIFGEGAGANVGNLAIAITNSEFKNWKRGITDNENGQDVKNVTITDNTLEDAAVYVSAKEKVTFTGNTVEGAYVNIMSYTTSNKLAVTATGNTLEDNTETTYYSINAGGAINAQDEFNVVAKGNNFNGYVGTDRIWGEVWGNARESFVIKVLDANGNVMGTSSLNNIDGIIDGDVTVTWSILFNAPTPNPAAYWSMEWTTAPTINNMPAKVELWVDGVKVSGGNVVLNGPDDLNKIVTIVTDADGKVLSCHTTLANAVAAGNNVAIIKAGTYTVPSGKDLTITGAVEGVKFANIGAHNMGGASMTFNNVTFEYGNENYKGLQHAGNLGYNNCTFNGQVFLYGQSETFNKCTFNQTSADAYNVWTYGAKEVAFNECTFNSAGKSVLIYHENATMFNDVAVTKSTFNASQTVDGKAAIEMDSSLTGGINLTIDAATTATGFGEGNVSGNSLWNNKKGNADAANNDITVKVGDDVVLAPIYEAQIGEVKYRNLQEAINAVQNGEIITLIADITENVILTEKTGLYYTIDGDGKTMNGTITVNSLSDTNDNRRITVKNIEFVDSADANVDFISSVNTNHYPRLTIEGCTFTGSGNDGDVAVRLKSSHSVVIKDCTGTGLHSFLQNTSGWNLTIENVTVTDSKSGLALGTVQGVTVKGCNITADGYGIRMDAQYNNNAVIESNTVKAFIPVVVRKAEVDSNITFNGTNEMTADNTDGLWCAIGTSEYEENGEMPTAATAMVNVTLNDTGLDLKGIYGYTFSGEGTEEKPYLINNINDLIVFRNNVNAGNDYSGKYVKLNADIDLNNEAWEPIGYMGENFVGNFDGGNKTISNLKVTKELANASENNGVGLFGRVDSPATIKNLTIENATIKGSLYVGAVVGYAYTGNSIENVTVKGNIAIDAWWYAGVIGGNGYMSLVNNCHVIGNDGSYIKGNNGSYIGGIWGFRGEGANNITNCTVTNLAVEGVDRVGGISGMAHYGNTISGCSVDDVTIAATDEDATTVGIIAGACQGTVSEPSTITYSEVVDVTVTIGGNNVDASIYGTNIDGTTPYTNYVARIGGMQYITLADAVAAANDGETIKFLPLATNKVVAMNASLYGKNVTITGTATVDWSKGFLFVGRGGEGNATLTFDGANLTSASNSASYGIHVSGREKGTNNKYDGTVVINNSTIELDYLINRGTMKLDNEAVLTVKNGFGIAGRPASETESGANATATITLDNESKLVVNNHNGMGLGQAANVLEGLGVMYINSGSTFECKQDFLVTANGTMNVNGGVVTTKVKITNNGVINVSGESTLNIASFEGEKINFLDGATIKDSNIGGGVFVAGNVTFDGDNTFNMIYDYGTLTDYYGTTAPMKWNVKEGASLTLTDKARYGLGYGDNVTIIGSIDNALTARENLTENERSLFMHGLVAQESKGWNCNSALTVENAYVVIGSNNSFGNKPGNYGGTYTFNIKNSVVDASRITFYEALSTSTFTFDGSDVKMGTFMTNDEDSKFTLKDSKVLSTTTTNGTDEGNYNAGQLILENSSLTYSATLTNKGTIELDAKSTLTAPAISGAGTITIDAADFVIGGGDVQVVYATINVDENNINVVNNNYVTAVITETGIVIKENNLEGEGTVDNPYVLETLTELELFRNKVNAGDNYADKYVKLTANVDLSATRSANNWEPIGTKDNPFKGIFDGDKKVISNLVVEGENNVGLFGYADNATIKNVIISNANVKGTDCVGAIAGQVYSISLIDNCHVNGNIKVEGQTNVGGIVGKYYTKVSNCSVIGDGVATSYVKGTYVASDLEGDNIGGIMGHCGEDNTLTANTVKNITISGTRKVGGIVGIADQSTDVKDCVVENVNIETTATAEYAEANEAKAGHGALVGSYQKAGSTNDGTVSACIVKNVTFVNTNNVTFSAGPITGGARGGSDGMLAPTGVTASNNDIYMSTITGSKNLYLMNAVAKIGSENYYTLQDAFNAGGEVVVLRDITLTETATIAAGKEVVLDLNGKTISQEKACTGNYSMILNKGNLTIIGNGNISFKDTGAGDPNFGWGSYTLRNEGTLVVENGTIEHLGEQNPGNGQPNRHMYCAIFQYSGSSTINGGTISTPTYRSARLWSGDMTINGGNFVGQLWLQAVNNTSDLTINGGTFTAAGNDGSSVFVSNSDYDVAFAVTGGTFNHKIGANDVEKAGVKGSVTGGTFSVTAAQNTSTKLLAEGFEFVFDGVNYTVKQTSGTQTREFASEGWYWFSTYINLYANDADGLDIFKSAFKDENEKVKVKQIKGQDGYIGYNSAWGIWTNGGLMSITNSDMYMINMNDAHTLNLTGEFAEEGYEIPLYEGWNWIGYPVNEEINVTDALANLVPKTGDIIKSQNKAAYYTGTSWKVELGWSRMVPGQGYKYYRKPGNGNTSLIYSTEVKPSSKSDENREFNHWFANAAQYPSNMTVIAMLNIDGEAAADNYEVAAFANGECRGSARPFYVEELDTYVMIMTINGEEVEELTFKCYDVNYGTEYELSNRFNYSDDAILGSIDEPYMFFMNTLGVEESTLDMINIYPNPTTRDRAINLQATCDNVEVFNALGVKIAEYQNVDTIDALETAGIYVIRLTINGEVKNCRLVVE